MSQITNNKCVIFDFDSTLTVLNASNYFASLSAKVNSKIPIKNNNPDVVIIEKNFIEMFAPIMIGIDKTNVFDPKYEVPASIGKGTLNQEASKLYAESFFGGKERIKKIKGMFAMIKSCGYTLIMSSMGTPTIVSVLLKLVDCFDDFDLIHVGNYLYTNQKYSFHSSVMKITPFSKEGLYGLHISKAEFMRSLMKRGYSTMIYVDDYPEEFLQLQQKLDNYMQCYRYHNLSLCQYIVDGQLGAFLYVGTLIKESSGIGDFEINIINWLVNAPSFIKQANFK